VFQSNKHLQTRRAIESDSSTTGHISSKRKRIS